MKKLKVTICLCLLAMFLVTALPSGVSAASHSNMTEFVPGEVIVGLEEITADNVAFLRVKGGEIIREISALNAVIVKVSVGREEAYIQSVASVAGFKYAELNGIVHATYVPNDPLWSSLWNMRIIEADRAWDIHKGSTSVVVAIVDTGVDYNHVDLSAHYVSGGYDWVNSDPNPWDDHGHGTHCAGVAAAVMDNSIGVVGVAQASIWAEKVLNAGGSGDWGDLASGITHATDAGVEIISMSLGGYGYSSAVNSACTYAWNNGVVLVGAAGNDNRDMDVFPHYPASLSTVIAVSGTDSNDNRYTMSNYGSDIEVAAPGVSVRSTYPRNGYAYMTGTSMSTPHVAGVAALLLSDIPSLTNLEIRNRLHEAVDDLGTPGWDIYYGYGRINAYKALTGGPEFEYSFQISPFSNVIHLNVNPGGWLNGYMTLGPAGWNPVLGKHEGGRFYMAIDVLPDESPGSYDLLFLVGTVATRTGQLIQTTDGLSYAGPSAVTLVPVTTQTETLEGPDITEAHSSQVNIDAWYVFQLNPYIDIIHLNTNPGGWLNGYDDVYTPDAPILGFAEGGKFYFAIDFISPGLYEMAFIAGSVATRDGDMIRTADGTTYDGPTYVWLT